MYVQITIVKATQDSNFSMIQIYHGVSSAFNLQFTCQLRDMQWFTLHLALHVSETKTSLDSVEFWSNPL